MLIHAFVLILCRKIPPEVAVKKVDTLYDKVKLLVKPKLPEGETEKETKAVIRLTIIKRKRPEPEEGEEPLPGPSVVEVDQEGKAIAINGRLDSVPYNVEIINTYAARLVRQDFMEAIVKQLPEYFKENEEKQKEILNCAQLHCNESEKAYIEAVCGENT